MQLVLVSLWQAASPEPPTKSARRVAGLGHWTPEDLEWCVVWGVSFPLASRSLVENGGNKQEISNINKAVNKQGNAEQSNEEQFKSALGSEENP